MSRPRAAPPGLDASAASWHERDIVQPIVGKPLIDYPCRWEWRIIGSDPEQMRAAAAEVLGQRDYTIAEANRSRAGRWLSMSLELEVASEADRNEVHRALTAHRFIRLAL